MRNLLFLTKAQRGGDFALLLLRILVGTFLIWGARASAVEPARMQEFVDFLGRHAFPKPELLAPLSVYAQLLVGLAFALGLFTRWAGIVCVVHFAVAIVMVERFDGLRASFPAASLVAIGFFLATHGAGRLSLDSMLHANDLPRAPASVRLKR